MVEATSKIHAANRRIVAVIQDLPPEIRLVLLEGLLAQEICTHPLSERDALMSEHIRDFPGILDATEEGMRLALTENARNGL